MLISARNSNVRLNLKAAVMLLFLSFTILNACPVRNILASAFTPVSTTPAEAGSASISYDSLRCTGDGAIQAYLVDVSGTHQSSIPLPLILTVIALFVAVFSCTAPRQFIAGTSAGNRSPGVPIFLRNRSIII